jgi:hypothetical protein
MIFFNEEDTNTKNIIVKILAIEWPLSTKEIYYKIKKNTDKNITYQAVFKSINELISANIIIKEKRNYHLNPDWVIQLNKFSSDLIQNYKQKIDEENMIEVGVGQSIKVKDALTAGTKAAQEAVSKLNNFKSEKKLVLIFSSVYYEKDFPELMKGIKKITGNTPTIGLTTFGEICDDKFSESLVVVVIAGKEENFSVQTSMVSLGYNLKNNFDFLFLPGPDRGNGLANVGPGFMKSLSKHIPKEFPLIGGVAADDSKLMRTYQFYGGKAYTDTAVFASIKTKVPFSITAEHGYQRDDDNKEFLLKLDEQGIKSITTISNGKNLGYKNSLDVYAHEVGIKVERLKKVMPYFRGPSDYDNWPRLLAFAQKSSPHLLSFPFDIKDKHLIFTGQHQENEPIIMMGTNPSCLIKALNSSVSKAVDKIDEDNSLILIIPCAVYNAVVPTLKNEIKQLKSLHFAKHVPVVGAYVNGEIGPYDNKNVSFCNGSVTCLVLGE